MDITLENYKGLNLKELALNSRFGDLKFEKSFPQLVNLQKMLEKGLLEQERFS